MWQRVKNVYHLFGAVFAAILYGFPGKRLIVIGVTGTDGKTTTSSLIYHILRNSGKKAVLISTVGAMFDDETIDTGLHATTPDSWVIQKLLKEAVDKKIQYVVLEVTSHALDQFRVWGIPFKIGVLTNVTEEHLDYHKTYENYLATKLKLLRYSKVAVVNRDDRSYDSIKYHVSSIKNKKIITYGVKNNSDITPEKFQFKTKLLGEFNQYNSLAAIAVTKELKIPDEYIKKALLSFIPPKGRQEIIHDKDFKVVVDFAHTPNSFQQILPAIKEMTKARLIHVFGCAAERDFFKRPIMGKISSEYADIIVLTSEDSRSEPREKIIEEIANGIQNSEFRTRNVNEQSLYNSHSGKRSASRISSRKSERADSGQARMTFGKNQNQKKFVFKISDRKEAIEFAASILQKDDVLLLTGKGHEQSINYGHGEESWDESFVAIEALKKLKKL